MLHGKKILITGPAGKIAFPIVESPTQHNEVWGVARFSDPDSDPDSRSAVEEIGITTRHQFSREDRS